LNVLDAKSDNDERHLPNKPPALHWAQTPREGELQVTFKFAFPAGTFTEALVRRVASAVSGAHAWEYEYEWTSGIFVRAGELVKVTAVLSTDDVVEVSGRIDYDEAAEEEEPGSKGRGALTRVWPFLARGVGAVLDLLQGDMRSMPYQLNLIFIGDRFFNCPSQQGTHGARVINSRSLDAVQSLSAIQRAGAVRFKVDEHIYSLRLDECFPGFKPTTLSHFRPGNFALPEEAEKEVAVVAPSPERGSSGTGNRHHPPLTVSISTSGEGKQSAGSAGMDNAAQPVTVG